MKKYDDGDNYGNKDGNQNNNTAAKSGYNGPIFGTITPQSHGGGLGNNGDGAAAAAHYVSTCWTIIYILSSL